MNRIKFIFFLLTFSCISHAQASVTLGGTRLIYNASMREAAISVTNGQQAVPHLIQSWVEPDGSAVEKAPFIVTPPLFRLDAGRENTLRVVYTGESTLSDNKESVYWLNVKSIPAVEKADQNRLLIAVKSRIKIFYRPASLNNEDAAEAWKKLSFSHSNGELIINNPTPYYVSLYSLKSGSNAIKNPPMVAPFSHESITSTGGPVIWQAINDFGGITTEMRQK
ncbi:molecular chaperone [Enterobacter hormaechei]|nr:molecular chaperone [Enterobacter hormaechei]MCU6154360.1 molecular chaperone [Enterobacter hormaechei]